MQMIKKQIYKMLNDINDEKALKIIFSIVHKYFAKDL